jgi:hypothetical protein
MKKMPTEKVARLIKTSLHIAEKLGLVEFHAAPPTLMWRPLVCSGSYPMHGEGRLSFEFRT